MKWVLFVWLFFFCCFRSNGQALPIIEQNGSKFYQYTIQEGQTLNGLQALFSTDIDQLLQLNPGLERGVEAGAQILIPVKRGTINHKVQAQQTLFAISRQYETSVDSLYLWNPGAKNGLKVGQVVRIHHAILPFDATQITPISSPVVAVKAPKRSDSIVKHTVLEKENLYAISKRYMVSIDTLMAINHLSSSRVTPGQEILVPIRQPNTQPVPVQAVPAPLPSTKSSFEFPVAKKESYHIAVFLPFQLDSNANNNRFISSAAIDYYMGLKLALDTLKQRGLVANVYVYDDNSTSFSLEDQLNSPQMKSVDLIFSPLQEKQAKIVATFAKINGIPVVFPVQMPASIVQMAPNFIAYTTPDQALVESLAKHLHQKFQGHTVILINSPIEADQRLEQQFKAAFAAVPTTQSKLKLQEANWSTYNRYKTIGAPQIVVSFSSERLKVAALLRAAAADSMLLVAGHKDWLDYKELDAPDVRDQSFLVALPSHFNYHDPQVIAFHKTYRKRYNADLSKMACLGYDLTLHIGMQLLGNAPPQKGLISNMQLNTSANSLFIENKAGVVVWYTNAQLLAPQHE